MTKLPEKMKAAVEAECFSAGLKTHQRVRILAAVASGMEEAKPTVQLLWALPGDPFNRFDCVVTDIGHADNILTVECQEAVKLASLAPAQPQAETANPSHGVTVEIQEPLLRPEAAKTFGEVSEALFTAPAQGTDGKEWMREAAKELVKASGDDLSTWNPDNAERYLADFSAIIARHCPPSASSLPADEGAAHPDSIALRAWQEAFGTSQLTHAIARLEVAEKVTAATAPKGSTRNGSKTTGRNTMKPEENIITKENAPEIQLPVSLRDYFAAKALQGLMARPDPRYFPGPSSDTDALRKWREEVFGSDAEICYAQADAMLAARSTPPASGANREEEK